MPRGTTIEAQQNQETPVLAPAKKDTGLRTVLHGWGKTPAEYQHQIDNFIFTGGVCRNVPTEIAEIWDTGKRPDGKPVVGRVSVHILPNDATEADFIKATGIQPMPVRRVANMLAAYSVEELRAAMGDERALKMTQELMKSFGLPSAKE